MTVCHKYCFKVVELATTFNIFLCEEFRQYSLQIAFE